MDAVETASQYGIDADRAVDYLADEAGTDLNFEVMNDVVTAMRYADADADYCLSEAVDSKLDRIRQDAKKRSRKVRHTSHK